MNTCPICRHRTNPLVLDKLYHHCTACHYIFLDRSRVLGPGEEKAVYSMHENTIKNSGYVAMFERFLKPLLPLCPPPAKVLDFGCGPGPVLAKLLEQKGYATSVYDPYFFAANEVFEHRYDLIVSTEVFEHIQKPLETVRTLARLLRPGGRIAVMTRFHNNNTDAFKQWYYRNDPTHIGFFDTKTFAIIALKTKLYLEYCDGRETAVMRRR